MRTITARCVTFAAALLAADTLSASPAAATTISEPIHTEGPCLLGHVNPADNNSACRLGGGYPEVDADENGVPIEKCGPSIDGKNVSTVDSRGGQRFFICKHTRNLLGDDYWEWNEVLHS
ncbi:MAG: hypothetical protein JWN03_1883 [Nocardia sp.]|uniref:hypothetical protein n=1 Tax=Nocardia sp. TaxID=1821 RepID=UPI0026347DF8|nr:hypothetical protein [Nocardia sp.]MCU1641608.1 hypothetical protein [Nocardia sp.]